MADPVIFFYRTTVIMNNLCSNIGWILISDNVKLISLSGLEKISSLTGDIYIGENQLLSNLEGLGSISFVGGALYIEANNSLVNLSGMENLKSVVGDLRIQSNYSLISLNGLENLDSINGNLRIENNPTLSDIIGFQYVHLLPNSDISIFGNNLLSVCEIQSICNYLAFNIGFADIYDNACGCNSPQEVEEACEHVSVIDTGIVKCLSVVPNPANSVIKIESPDLAGSRISIFNANGKEMLTLQSDANATSLNISAFPPGLYFVRLNNDKTVEIGKFVKQ